MMKRGTIATLLTLVGVTAFAACSDDDPTLARKTIAGADAGTGEPALFPFEPMKPAVYVPKVKGLLTGLAPTAAEVQAVEKDPNALKGLIDAWMTLPSFRTRMTDFFRNAFQQNQVDLGQLMTNINVQNINLSDSARGQLQRNLMDSFPLTAWQLVVDGHPFTETMTTRRYLMTTALATFLAYTDEMHTDDELKGQKNRIATRNPIPQLVVDTTSSIPVSQTFDATSPNFMHLSLPSSAQPNGCATTSQTMLSSDDPGNFYRNLFNTIYGAGQWNPCNVMNNGGSGFGNIVLTDSDFNDWHWVELHTDAKAAGTTPAFYEVTKLRTATDMTIHSDRLGFFGTLAFNANWGTNVTNEMRVTANQSLIVALGQSIQGEDTVVNFPVDATDASHASNPACMACHTQLDPFKQFFRQSFTESYSEQTSTQEIAKQAGFAIGGVNANGKGVKDLANIFAQHPRLPIAWTAKLAYWANSTPVIETDPEVLRIAGAFSGANFDFRTLVREVFSSPLVTWAAETETTKTNGVIVSIARRDQLCASLSNRLKIDDICGQNTTNPSQAQRNIANRAILLATDTYFRSYAIATVPTSADLFFRETTEAICSMVADQVVDVKDNSKYTSNDPDAAIEDFVTSIMAIPTSDERYPQAKAILLDNFTQSSAVAKVDKTTALKATFQLACLAPTSVVVGL